MWEYYGRKYTLGSLPAVTNLAGPLHRKCNYNLDFQGKEIQLLVEQEAENQEFEVQVDAVATIDCGLEMVKDALHLEHHGH